MKGLSSNDRPEEGRAPLERFPLTGASDTPHLLVAHELADRRLRRYLTWHLQRVRGETLTSAADFPVLLAPAVIVELAPISARLDRRFDRQVIGATPQPSCSPRWGLT